MSQHLSMDPNRSAGVTIVTPVYNRLSYLADTLNSVLTQTWQDWELIVVDDGSQEDVAAFMTSYTDTRVRYIRQANQGNAAARNAGIAQGSGEYIICLDSDDVWHPAMLETAIAVLAARPNVDVAYAQVQAIGSDGAPLFRPIGPHPHDGDLLEPLLLGYPILPSSALARRRCFEQWGGYTSGLDDWELWLRWARHGCHFVCITECLLFYRVHDQNFDLNYDRRRTVHFAMLDRFYAQEHLPSMAMDLREIAYANQHLHFASLAWQLGRPEDGTRDFAAAVLRNPAYVADLDFHTRIACAHQGRLDAGTAAGLDLATAEDTLLHCLAALFARPNLPTDLGARRNEAYGTAYLALARLAYGVARDMGAARRLLRRGLAQRPAALWRTDWLLWASRALVGYRTVQALKAVLGPTEASHA